MGGILGHGKTSYDLCCDTTVTFGHRECCIVKTIMVKLNLRPYVPECQENLCEYP